MKNLFVKIKEWVIWLTSNKVREAINGDATYDEVCKIVEEEWK